MAVSEKSIVQLDSKLRELLDDDEEQIVTFIESYLQYRDAGLDFGDAVQTAIDDLTNDDDVDGDEEVKEKE